MDRMQGIVARASLQMGQDLVGPERYVDGIWLQRTREEAEANIRRRVRYYGHSVWRSTIKPFFQKWMAT